MSDTEQTIKILAIESSCDETAAAVVVNGRDMRSNVISSQIALHTLYGGVVPEIASRKHIEKINQVIAQALSDACHARYNPADYLQSSQGKRQASAYAELFPSRRFCGSAHTAIPVPG